MDWGQVDPKWADEGRSGIVETDDFCVIFMVLRSDVDGATVLIFDSDLIRFYPVGGTRTISWSQDFWVLADEI